MELRYENLNYLTPSFDVDYLGKGDYTYPRKLDHRLRWIEV